MVCGSVSAISNERLIYKAVMRHIHDTDCLFFEFGDIIANIYINQNIEKIK